MTSEDAQCYGQVSPAPASVAGMTQTRGRPRVSQSPTGRGTAQDILDAAARLVSTHGLAATSTHAIAQQAGIRQATLYHHFAGKNEIVATLLLGTVSPSVRAAEALLGRPEPARVRLWTLCERDCRLLAEAPYNLGSLYLLPEITAAEFGEFHALRRRLFEAYLDLVSGCAADDPPAVTDQVFGLVESVILLRRRAPERVTAATPALLAGAALRLVGVPGGGLAAIARRGAALRDALELPV